MKNLQNNRQLENSLILAEYQSLREEILARLSRVFRLQQSLLLGILVYATTFLFPKLSNINALDQTQDSISITSLLFYSFLLILPLIAFVVELICTSEQDAIFRTGIYIKENIEKVYKKSNYKGWEDWLEKQEKVKRRRTSENLLIFSRRFIIIPLYCISSSFICSIGFLNLIEISLPFYAVGAIATAVFIIYISIYTAMIRKLNKAQKEEFTSSIYNLLVLDVDGCLLDSNRKISHLNKKAITFLKEKGIAIVLASGRGTYSLTPICQELNLKGFHVTCHGASIINVTNNQEELLPTSLSNKNLKAIMRKLSELSITWVAFGKENYYCKETDSEKVKSQLIYRSDLPENKFNLIREIKNVHSFTWEEKISKILCYVNHNESAKANELKNSLSKDYKVFQSTPETLEIIHKEAFKSKGVIEALKRRGLSDYRSLVVGDYDNDIEVLKWGHQAVAPSNASINVRKIEEINVLETSNDQDLIWKIAQIYFNLDTSDFSE